MMNKTTLRTLKGQITKIAKKNDNESIEQLDEILLQNGQNEEILKHLEDRVMDMTIEGTEELINDIATLLNAVASKKKIKGNKDTKETKKESTKEEPKKDTKKESKEKKETKKEEPKKETKKESKKSTKEDTKKDNKVDNFEILYSDLLKEYEGLKLNDKYLIQAPGYAPEVIEIKGFNIAEQYILCTSNEDKHEIPLQGFKNNKYTCEGIHIAIYKL